MESADPLEKWTKNKKAKTCNESSFLNGGGSGGDKIVFASGGKGALIELRACDAT